MWLDGYHQQFGNRLEDFLSKALPTTLEELTPLQREQVTEGSEEFPLESLLNILNSDHDHERKVIQILAITGTWMNATSGSQWALGPLSSTAYSERVGIGIRWDEIAFSPLLKIAENLVDCYSTWPVVLKEFADMHEADREYYRRRILETRSSNATTAADMQQRQEPQA